CARDDIGTGFDYC
nr:immunoglobulin heavy chain junction region [Macaca mulatta]